MRGRGGAMAKRRRRNGLKKRTSRVAGRQRHRGGPGGNHLQTPNYAFALSPVAASCGGRQIAPMRKSRRADMTFKYACAAAALAGSLLMGSNVALAQRGIAGVPRAAGMAQSSSPTSGGLPTLPSSGAIPPAPTSGALPGLQPSFPTIGQSSGTSTMLVPQSSVGTRTRQGTPYQPPCGTYPLPQC